MGRFQCRVIHVDFLEVNAKDQREARRFAAELSRRLVGVIWSSRLISRKLGKPIVTSVRSKRTNKV
jgi:hypothetical protein